MDARPALLLSLLACAPPALEVEGLDGPVRGEVTLQVVAEGPVTLLTPTGREVLTPGLAVVDTAGWPDGSHTLTLSATRWGRTTTRTLPLHTDNSAPDCAFDERALSGAQGQALAFLVRCDEPFTATLEVLGRTRSLYPLGDGIFRAMVGVPIRTPPGPAEVTLRAEDDLGNAATYELTLQVDAVDWPFTGKLPMSRRKMATEPEAVRAMREARDAVYATHTPEATWSTPFALPVDGGTHTSAFGSYREYPDGRRSHHDAEDIARRRHTPIHAPAPGRVALATHQAIHGNAVLLDHGHGVVSLYSHLHRLDVQAGQPVQTGDLLGTMGSTGRTTGPHLHWGIIVDGVPVDPMTWTHQAFTAEGARWWRPER